MAIPWRLAKSLVQLNGQVRDIVGPIRIDQVGDAAHASRSSDHNPWIDDPSSYKNVVSACDYFLPRDKLQLFVDELVKSRDPRIKYIIHNGRMWRSYDKISNGRVTVRKWQPAKYVGPNPHTSHVHLSVNSTKSLYDDTRPWQITLGTNSSSRIPDLEDEMSLQRGDTGSLVELLQIAVNAAIRTNGIKHDLLETDGVYGPLTASAIAAYQKAADIPRHAPGVCDSITFSALMTYIER